MIIGIVFCTIIFIFCIGSLGTFFYLVRDNISNTDHSHISKKFHEPLYAFCFIGIAFIPILYISTIMQLIK